MNTNTVADHQYHPEPYWSEVAERINSRDGENIMAGDDTPFYRYKRKRFLQLLHSLPFEGKHVLELGCGPGGNLLEISKRKPASLNAADISQSMIDLAKKHLGDFPVNFTKINGEKLPFEDDSYDIVFSATVLQHNSDEEMMKRILGEMCRVSKDRVVLFERIEKKLKGDDLCVGRPVAYYEAICEKHGFKLAESEFINIQTSYLVSGAIRKLMNPAQRKEGQKLTKLAEVSQKISLPITAALDKVFTAKRDLAKLVFTKA